MRSADALTELQLHSFHAWPACMAVLQNGTITVEELRQSISSLGEDIGTNDLKEMVRRSHASGAGDQGRAVGRAVMSAQPG